MSRDPDEQHSEGQTLGNLLQCIRAFYLLLRPSMTYKRKAINLGWQAEST